MCGVVIALMGLVNNSPGTATAIVGLAVSFAYNPPVKVIIAAIAVLYYQLLQDI